MAEEKERSTPKSRLESLSDLIFGLALSIGALTLIGQAPSNFNSLLFSLSYYGFSFLILISVWYRYTRTMSSLRIETSRAVYLNIVLLFLVSIEPFLFNELVFSKLSTQNVSVLYALDLGGLFLILGFLAGSIIADDKAGEKKKHFILQRNTQLLGAAIFFVSILPIFWTLQIPIGVGIPLRFILWIFTLFLHNIRRLLERRK